MEKYVLLKYHGSFYISNWRKNECLMYLLDKSILTKYKSMYESNKNNTLIPNSTIHFSKLTKLPQYKLKEYINNNKLNIKKSRNINDIDTLIISNELINEYFNEDIHRKLQVINEYYKIPTEFYEQNIESLLNNSHHSVHLSDIVDDADNISYLLLNKNNVINFKPSNTKISNLILKIKQFDVIKGIEITNGWGSIKAYETCNLFTDIVNNYGDCKFNIVFDEKINETLNEDMTMDIDVFSNIVDMLNSNDESNLKLAKEIVSNLDPISSRPYILLLLHLFPDFRKIDNNNNFRYLLQSLNKEKNSYTYNSTSIFLSNILNIYPEYKQQMFEGLGKFINKKNNKNIIAEIKVS